MRVRFACMLLIAAACVSAHLHKQAPRASDKNPDLSPFFSELLRSTESLGDLSQLEQARQTCAKTGQKYAVCYSERLQNEAAEYAAELVRSGVIGRVIQVIGLGPHRLLKANRPDWFFEKEHYGGIICDIGIAIERVS